jgi:VanZ family protein
MIASYQSAGQRRDKKEKAIHAKQQSSSIPAIVAVFAWAAFIFWMSAHTSGQMSTGIFAVIKQVLDGFFTSLGIQGDAVSVAGHFTEYLIFGILLANALRGKLELKHAAIAAIIIASLYGVTDEIHQLFVSGRACDPMDWLVDTVAATIGSCAFCAIAHARRQLRGHQSEGLAS